MVKYAAEEKIKGGQSAPGKNLHHQDFRQPSGVIPWLAEAREGKPVNFRQRGMVDDPLAGAQMPPGVGVHHRPEGHEQDGQKRNRDHQSADGHGCLELCGAGRGKKAECEKAGTAGRRTGLHPAQGFRIGSVGVL
jgi:hypothetical protein